MATNSCGNLWDITLVSISTYFIEYTLRAHSTVEPLLMPTSLQLPLFLVPADKHPYIDSFNPLSPNSDQHQFSPDDIRTFSRD